MLCSLMHKMSRIGLSMVIWTKKEEGSKYFLKKEDKLCCKSKDRLWQKKDVTQDKD